MRMTMISPLLTVIIPTLADSKRAASLKRAIASIFDQKEVAVHILVVVNGQRFDNDLVKELESRSELQVMKVALASLSNAIHQGRMAVTTPFFSFLDDDDEYLPKSILRRINKLHENPLCIMVASGGFRDSGSQRTASAYNLSRAMIDPFHELSVNNWMTSCGAIYRSSLVGPDIFKDIPAHLEWTYLAYKLLMLGPFCMESEPCYIIHDTPGSLSKSTAYSLAPAKVMREVLKINLSPAARQSVLKRLASLEHDLASYFLSNGFRLKAFKHHMKSLMLPGGYKYISFSRHLFKP